ncbi:MAG: hypothetical protein NC212_02695 [Staphylococcus sp.]|nr:hypothetical protein [Staphylococcus sp.]
MEKKFFDFHSQKVRNVLGIGVVALALASLSACSDDAPDNGNDVPQPGQTAASYTVKTSDASRIINYTPATSRSEAASSFEMPACPSIPAEAISLVENINYGTLSTGSYYLNEGEVLETGLNLAAGDITIYVGGTLNLQWLKGAAEDAGRCTIYVLGTGKITYSSTIVPKLDIYNYGELDITGITLGEGDKLYSSQPISCDVLGVNAGAEFFSKESIEAREIRLNGTAVACSFVAEEKITFNAGSFKASYFKANELVMHGGSIELDDNGLVEANEALFSNADTRLTVNGNKAVFAAKVFKTNNIEWPKQSIGAGFICDIEKVLIGNDEKECPVNDLELTISNDNLQASVPAAGCHDAYPGGGSTPDPTPDPTPEPEIIIEKITDIDPLDPDHDHGIISATCITFAGDKAYASYHLRGEGQKGCIEVIEDNGNKLSLLSYMISPDYDFNHVIVDGNTIIPVGNHVDKGAFVGALPIDFAASEGVRDDFKVKELTTDEVIYTDGKNGPIKAGYKNAGDGNCIIRQGNYYYVNTYRGYGALNLDFSKVEGSFHPTTGSSKHVAVENGKTVILSLNSFTGASSESTVNVYGADDYTFSNVTSTYQAGTISPIDGKNVVAIDGENIYACLGHGGLKRLNDGKEFHAGENSRVPANGVAIDANYIYVAMGSFVYVLDKNMNEVTHYHAASEKSANYIALHNDKIYVAFGEDGIQVFKLNKR